MDGRLRSVPLFAELGDSDIAQLEARSSVITLAKGDELFAEGDPGNHAYVISAGEIEIVKRTGEREVLLAVRTTEEMIGEMALLQDAPRSATARARTPVELIAIPKAEIDTLMNTSIEAVRGFFRVLLDRWRSTQALLTQSERMAQLGTLTAGLAHELNNPAAAVGRAAGQLGGAISGLQRAEQGLRANADPESAEQISRLRARFSTQAASIPLLDAMTRSDLEAAVEDDLLDRGIEDAWRLAPAVVAAGLTESIGEIVGGAGDHAAALLEVLHAEGEVAALLHEVEEGAARLSAIVGALKSYAYLDQAPVQDVDLVAGLDDTLLILKAKLAGIEVRREYDPNLPRIQAYGGELNQVWTNLIDNAADAIHATGRTNGIVVVRAFPQADHVVVEVEDNGPGIPEANRHRVFDSFFTTKAPGSGTGLGLNISYSIVVHRHRGEITVASEPGRTVFRVTVPRHVVS